MATGQEVETAVDEQAIELVYQPTPDDMTAVVHAQWRLTPSGRRAKWLFMGSAVMAAAFTAVIIGLGGSGITAIPLWCLVLVGPLVAFLSGRKRAGSLYRFAEQYGQTRVSVDAHGVRATAERGGNSFEWSVCPYYTETPVHFLIFGKDKGAEYMAALPKRGLAVASDTDRLRALLDRHLTRV